MQVNRLAMWNVRRTLSLMIAGLGLLVLVLSGGHVFAQPPASAPAPGATSGDGASGVQPGSAKPAAGAFMRPKGVTAQEPPAPPSGVLARFYSWVAYQQRTFSQSMAAALREMKNGHALGASLTLIGLSFLYGVLHAAGPGHGKAIVSSYMLTDGQTVRRGVQLAFLSAAVQALAAITLFGVVVLVLRGARREIVATETLLEQASWAIVAAFGAWLLWRQLRGLFDGAPAGHAHGHHGHALAHDHGHGHGHAAHDHGHGHKHAHDHAHAHDHKPAAAARVHAHDHHGHDHAHAHDHAGHGSHAHDHRHGAGEACDTCGHSHLPAADELKGAWSWKRALTLAFAVGMRPCTGAIGVLFVASGLGLMWAGIASTIAMSIGTAITVSALATLAVSSKDLATRLAGVSDNRFAARVQTAFGLAGAALVFLLGATFLYYSLTTAAPV